MSGKGKKTLFWLAVGYITGGLVASLYGKKTGTSLRKDIDEAKAKGEGSFKVIADHFITMHSNMIDDLKAEVMTEKNKAIFNEHKEEVLKLLDDYKAKGTALLSDLKKKGEGYADEASLKLKKLYDDKITSINNMKNIAPQKASELKEKLKLAFEEIKVEMEEIIKSKGQ